MIIKMVKIKKLINLRHGINRKLLKNELTKTHQTCTDTRALPITHTQTQTPSHTHTHIHTNTHTHIHSHI